METDIKTYRDKITAIIKEMEKLEIPKGINGDDLTEAITGLTLYVESIKD